MLYIDLHSHTTYSDGTSTVENSLTQAEASGLSLFSVSDHNTVSAYNEIKSSDTYEPVSTVTSTIKAQVNNTVLSAVISARFSLAYFVIAILFELKL